MTSEDTARVFFALWPDAAVRVALVFARDRLVAKLGGRPMRPDTLHLTLVFIGQVGTDRLPELSALAAGVRGSSFTVDFDQARCWRRNRIAHLGASQPPDGLHALVRQLEFGLEAAGFTFDHRPYVPHVTLIREADCTKENPAPESVPWPARDFVLVSSSLRPEGARYQQLGCWPLL